MNWLTKIFGGNAKGVIDSVGGVLDNLITNKEELAKAKLELEKEMNRRMEAAEANAIRVIELEINDRSNARAMQIAALQQEDKFSKRFLYYLSSFVILSATGMGIALFFWDIPESNRRLIEMFADIYLFAGAIMVLQFFFGSSKGSQDKDKMMVLK